jgi:hypothetical protein
MLCVIQAASCGTIHLHACGAQTNMASVLGVGQPHSGDGPSFVKRSHLDARTPIRHVEP